MMDRLIQLVKAGFNRVADQFLCVQRSAQNIR